MSKKFIPNPPPYIKAFMTNEELKVLHKQQKKWDELARKAMDSVEKANKKIWIRDV